MEEMNMFKQSMTNVLLEGILHSKLVDMLEGL